MDRPTRYTISPLEGSRFLMESAGTSYAIGTPGTSLEQCIGSTSEVDDTPGLTAVLQQILKFDPVQRPSALDILSYPWFTSSSSGSESE